MKNKQTIRLTNALILPLLCILLSACETSANETSKKKFKAQAALKKESRTSIKEIPLEDASKVKKMNKMTKDQQLVHCQQDLAKQLKVDQDEISVLTSRRLTWRSGALGCPRDGFVYTQALVPGRVFVLAVDDQTYRYHAAIDEEPFLCPEGRAESAVTEPGDL